MASARQDAVNSSAMKKSYPFKANAARLPHLFRERCGPLSDIDPLSQHRVVNHLGHACEIAAPLILHVGDSSEDMPLFATSDAQRVRLIPRTLFPGPGYGAGHCNRCFE